jgi:hypothetical protein
MSRAPSQAPTRRKAPISTGNRDLACVILDMPIMWNGSASFFHQLASNHLGTCLIAVKRTPQIGGMCRTDASVGCCRILLSTQLISASRK